MRFIFSLITLGIGLLGVLFALLNAKAVPVNYYLGTKELPLSALIIGSLVMGIVIGMFLNFWRLLKLKVEVQWWRYKVATMEKDKEHSNKTPTVKL